jgi:hypothetical protein
MPPEMARRAFPDRPGHRDTRIAASHSRITGRHESGYQLRPRRSAHAIGCGELGSVTAYG